MSMVHPILSLPKTNEGVAVKKFQMIFTGSTMTIMTSTWHKNINMLGKYIVI